jgi:hypothetical protein
LKSSIGANGLPQSWDDIVEPKAPAEPAEAADRETANERGPVSPPACCAARRFLHT